jgi:23S rRNA (uracil1939-C5)-methyltransferase
LTGCVELTATRMVAGGDALGRIEDGRVALIDGALPGERVRIEVTADKADLLRGRVVEVLEPSAARVTPPCVHAREGCGGCGWQHVAVDAQPQLKLDIIRDALNRIAHIPEPPLAAPVLLPTDGFRTTVRALVVDGKPAFRKHQSHDPVMIDSCMVAHPAIDELLRDGKFGRATEVTLRVATGTGERAALAEPAEIVMDLPPDVMRGKNAAVHEVIDGHSMRVSINSFFQSRTDGAATLARLVRGATGPDRILADLYCGVGLFAITADQPKRIVAVERGRAAVADAKFNLKGRDARIVRSDVGKWKGNKVDVVVADPSRAGLGRDGARAVLACDPERVVLVSCDAAALARDIGLLVAAGFTLTSVTLVDLFAHTPHVECVTVLDR